ncbi:MAG: alkaline shock response membrane anchor protein AmaP [Candidatus Bipolaricaulota bacterium]|nr:alkaline shock response membrane anchor protein AmaP [Candidatus Bipolaricaulota bacterium]MBS3792420.1 alkaline shock response membrane anchor protein AmaP [Candidatus Bipolaricaulota bacterium]
MNNLKDRFLQISYVLLTLIWLAIAAGFIGYAFGFYANFDIQEFLANRAGNLLLYGIGALAALTGLYFFRKLVISYRLLLTFVHESELGNIHISHNAVKELTSEILKKKFNLSSFRTTLSQATDGVHIDVRAKVGSNSDIGELGEEVQEVLRQEVHDKTGLTVGRVDFYTRGVEGPKEEVTSRPEDEELEEIKLEGDNDEN